MNNHFPPLSGEPPPVPPRSEWTMDMVFSGIRAYAHDNGFTADQIKAVFEAGMVAKADPDDCYRHPLTQNK